MHKRVRTLLVAAAAVVTVGGAFSAASVIAGTPASASELATMGKPFSQTESELTACLARNCTPPEDIAASIAHADNLFAAGKWKESAAAFEASRDRNRKFAAQYPVEVAGLLRAYAHISLLRHNTGAYRNAIFEAADALKEGLGENDPRVLVAQVEVVDVIARDARPFNTAENRYLGLLQQAQARKLGSVEGLILYRIATLYFRGATLDRSRYERRAIEACNALIGSQRPEFAPYAAGARALRDTLSAYFGDPNSAGRLVVATRNWTGGRPELLSFEPIEYTGTLVRGTRFETQDMVVVFWVQPDGRVRDDVTALIGDGDRTRGEWLQPITSSIQSRHYAPIPGMALTDPGVLRVERYTLTARKGQPPAIAMRDLSDSAPMAVEMPSKQLVVGK